MRRLLLLKVVGRLQGNNCGARYGGDLVDNKECTDLPGKQISVCTIWLLQSPLLMASPMSLADAMHP